MTVQHYQSVLTSVWVLTICAGALVTGVTSIGVLAIVGVVALVPPIIMQWLWREPPPSMSESIRDARR